jgi:hypothetical protein
MNQYLQPEEKLFKVWDFDRLNWWDPGTSKKHYASKKRMRTLWSAKHYAERSVQDQIKVMNRWLAQPMNYGKELPENKYAPVNYEIIEFRLAEVVND